MSNSPLKVDRTMFDRNAPGRLAFEAEYEPITKRYASDQLQAMGEQWYIVAEQAEPVKPLLYEEHSELPGYEWQGLHLVRKGTRNERIRNERLPLVVPTESKSSAALYVLIALIAPLAVGFLVWAALQ